MEERRTVHGLTMMHKIVNNVAPTYLTNKIRYHNNIHSYNTRNKNKIVVGISQTASYDRSFFPTFSRLYNDLNSVKNCSTSSITTIKKHAKQFVTTDARPRRVRKTFLGRRRKYELSEHFLLLKKMLGAGYHLTSK